MRFIFIFPFIFTLVSSCLNDQKINEKITGNPHQGERLGASEYYIILPGDIKAEEVRGKEGYLGYNILSRDSILNFLGTIEIEEGHPIGSADKDSSIHAIKQDSIYDFLLGKKTVWVIEQTATGYFEAKIPKNSFVSIWAKDKKDILRMIKIFSTLNKR